MKIVSRDWLTKVGHSIMSTGKKCPTAKRLLFSLDLPAFNVVFIDILPKWGLFGIIKQICHASVGIPQGKTILPRGDIPSGYPQWHGIFV